MKEPGKGFIPVMLTTFKENGEVDYEALTRLTEFYLEAGAIGLFANCLSSEMFELSPEERRSTTAHIVKVARGTVPVVATGSFGASIEDKANFIKEIYDTGVDAVIVLANSIAEENESDEVFDERVFKLLDLTGEIPLGFYECPVPYKRLIKPVQLRKFVATNRIIYHKDTSLDIDQVAAKIAAAGGYNFGLYDAYMGHAVQSLHAGAAGLSCIQGNFFPEVVVWLCENYNKPDLEEQVLQVQQFFIDHMDVMHDVYPLVAKYYLQKRGMKMPMTSRRDVGAFSQKEKEGIDRLYMDCNNLIAELNIV